MTPSDPDRVARAIEAVSQASQREGQDLRMTREEFAAEVMGRYGLPPEWAGRVTGERPGQIKAQVRRLAVEYANTHSSTTDSDQSLAPAVQTRLVPGHADFGSPDPFDLAEVVRQVQHPY